MLAAAATSRLIWEVYLGSLAKLVDSEFTKNDDKKVSDWPNVENIKCLLDFTSNSRIINGPILEKRTLINHLVDK